MLGILYAAYSSWSAFIFLNCPAHSTLCRLNKPFLVFKLYFIFHILWVFSTLLPHRTTFRETPCLHPHTHIHTTNITYRQGTQLVYFLWDHTILSTTNWSTTNWSFINIWSMTAYKFPPDISKLPVSIGGMGSTSGSSLFLNLR